ncbi:hypothetical protein M758_10G154100 [Ceratodon purpureus]|uniref:Uncharacterized protein n=1 Tax=Ceratodon purpureus TaxID=3225 RepID=A0A8T0GR41_CERPU|nr:hypothetical protein KC19_10G158100 [Ceratodon purpureus]KAG0604220.1 hypothetical protein M758_10G154100 [Ceratodon purpureus]
MVDDFWTPYEEIILFISFAALVRATARRILGRGQRFRGVSKFANPNVVHKMSDCYNRYGTSSKDEGCSPAQPVSHLLRASAIVATAVFLLITIVLLIFILHKRRMLLLVRLRQRVQSAPPALYVWSGTTNDSEPAAPQPATETSPTVAKSSKGSVATAAEPVSCVIMAGEDRPTYLARPLPREEFVDVSLDGKLDELEKGKRKASLNSSR